MGGEKCKDNFCTTFRNEHLQQISSLVPLALDTCYRIFAKRITQISTTVSSFILLTTRPSICFSLSRAPPPARNGLCLPSASSGDAWPCPPSCGPLLCHGEPRMAGRLSQCNQQRGFNRGRLDSRIWQHVSLYFYQCSVKGSYWQQD